jgi:hypothetical protein
MGMSDPERLDTQSDDAPTSGPEEAPEVNIRAMVARYDSVIASQEAALTKMRELRLRLPEAAREMVERSDIQPLEQLLRSFQERREYWLLRQARQTVSK